jgi:hypothetical protein
MITCPVHTLLTAGPPSPHCYWIRNKAWLAVISRPRPDTRTDPCPVFQRQLQKVNRATTKLAAVTPTGVARRGDPDRQEAGITVWALDVGVDSSTLETIARQLWAEQIKNGARLP